MGGPRLSDVFGIGEQVKESSYIDRGGLDSQFRYAIGAERHIVTHGASKQGKSWLRSKALSRDDCILVQCQTGTTPESLFTEALSILGIQAILKKTEGNDFEGTLSAKGTGSIGTSLLGKVGLAVATSGKAAKSSSVEKQPLGEYPANLSWVSRILLASGRRLVLEDCHYLTDDSLKDLSFILKGLLGHGVQVVIAGVWAQDHLLTYYNGDLQGRLEDIHLTWSSEDLDQVLEKGSNALGVRLSSSLRNELIDDAAGSVGTLQQLAEQLFLAEKILDRQAVQKYLTPGDGLERARRAVATSMRHRFEAFADHYSGASQQLAPQCRQPTQVLRVLFEASDRELIEGLQIDEVEKRLAIRVGNSLATGEATSLAGSLLDAQARMAIRPPVLEYNPHSGRVYVADRSLLFFRRYGTPRWPWGT
jgi:hypothetical protein